MRPAFTLHMYNSKREVLYLLERILNREKSLKICSDQLAKRSVNCYATCIPVKISNCEVKIYLIFKHTQKT